jgi:hypothetical protein
LDSKLIEKINLEISRIDKLFDDGKPYLCRIKEDLDFIELSAGAVLRKRLNSGLLDKGLFKRVRTCMMFL